MQTDIDIDRLARATPIWVPPIVFAGFAIPLMIILAALWNGHPGTALAVFLAVSVSNLGTMLARRYYDPHRRRQKTIDR